MRTITVFVGEKRREILQTLEIILPLVVGQRIYLADIELNGLFEVASTPEIIVLITPPQTKVIVPLRRVTC